MVVLYLGVPTALAAVTITDYPVVTSGSNPFYITKGPDGNLWFTESAAGKIGKITTSGVITEYTITTTSGSSPQGITAGPDGNLWFTEGTSNQIGMITPSGIISEYTIPTATSGPLGITAGPDGKIWFAESSGNKVGNVAGLTIPPVTAASSPNTTTLASAQAITAPNTGYGAPSARPQYALVLAVTGILSIMSALIVFAKTATNSPKQ